jgi:type VI protein secretion system component VasK
VLVRKLVRVTLGLLAFSLVLPLLATPAYADTVEPRDTTWAWLVATGIIVLVVALIAWRALSGLRRRRSQGLDQEPTEKKGREPPG